MNSFTPLSRQPRRALVALVGAVLICGGCSTLVAPPPQFRQVVLVWLKHPNRPDDRAQLVRAARSLRMARGVVRVETSNNVADLPAGTDRSFDLAITITFRDRGALERFGKGPRHRAAVGRYLRSLVRRQEIYNFDGR